MGFKTLLNSVYTNVKDRRIISVFEAKHKQVWKNPTGHEWARFPSLPDSEAEVAPSILDPHLHLLLHLPSLYNHTYTYTFQQTLDICRHGHTLT